MQSLFPLAAIMHISLPWSVVSSLALALGLFAVVADAATCTRPSVLREWRKLSRAERIRLVKAKRESGLGGLGIVRAEDIEQGMDREKRDSWGPGTEVVQELKDVIWKVGERKRRMASGTESDSGAAATKSATSSPQVNTAHSLHNNSDSTDVLHLQPQTIDDIETTLETI